ncbi:response regulator transcription factor [Caproiciproducens faecalis]|uniref:Stage 0 sporulation protein A homolog n=1 Tax=Caproiciproducens faecalis TaxID=2820301 RepID=A0ABS7DM57_9FIRM|nr:response regulator transcription factor [Caproiciproducens faecalis]MBW7572389.1 response regulator transcription factor [Caproiciproducens faecalis]
MKLMLVDDHPLFMEGLKYLLETHGISVVGTAGNGKEAFYKAKRIHPDIILMDIRMPECSGIDALKLIKAEMPDIKVVMLTTSDEDDDLFETIKCGASGYLLKNISAGQLMNMLSDLENDGVPLSPGIAARLLKEFGQDRPNTEKPETAAQNEQPENCTLTQRQTEILKMVAGGLTYKKVGENLGLSERTVKYHMGRIIELLHVENRAQVIACAAKMGMTEEK